MNPGDLVRFRNPPGPDWMIGLVVKYENYPHRIVTLLCNNRLYEVTKYNVQKFGRRYLDEKG